MTRMTMFGQLAPVINPHRHFCFNDENHCGATPRSSQSLRWLNSSFGCVGTSTSIRLMQKIGPRNWSWKNSLHTTWARHCCNKGKNGFETLDRLTESLFRYDKMVSSTCNNGLIQTGYIVLQQYLQLAKWRVTTKITANKNLTSDRSVRQMEPRTSRARSSFKVIELWI